MSSYPRLRFPPFKERVPEDQEHLYILPCYAGRQLSNDIMRHVLEMVICAPQALFS